MRIDIFPPVVGAEQKRKNLAKLSRFLKGYRYVPAKATTTITVHGKDRVYKWNERKYEDECVDLFSFRDELGKLLNRGLFSAA